MSSTLIPPGTGKGIHPQMMLAGLAVIALGLVALCVGLFSSYGLRLGPIPIPLSLAGPVVAAVGGLTLYLSTNQLKCHACRKPLTQFTAWFPLDDEAAVVDASQRAPSTLRDLGIGSPAEESIEVNLEACEHCQRVGLLVVERSGLEAPLLERSVTGPIVAPLLGVIKERAELHEARYEEAAE